MIAFHNAHWAPEPLCRVLYHSIPEELHVPIVFYRNGIDRDRHGCFGVYYPSWEQGGPHIAIWLWPHLARKYHGLPGSATFQVWTSVLLTAFHEVRHRWQELQGALDPMSLRNEYERPWATSLLGKDVEGDADRWARLQLKKLAHWSPTLFCPKQLTGFLGALAQKRSEDAQRQQEEGYYCNYTWRWFQDVLWRLTGGMLSTADVARLLHVSRYFVARYAADLAAGCWVSPSRRNFRTFRWGDLEKVALRVARERGGCGNI